MSELLDFDGVKARLGIGRDRLYELLQTGEIPSVRVGEGRLWHVSSGELDAWMASRSSSAGRRKD